MSPFSSKKPKLNSPGSTHKLFTRESHNFRYHRTPTLTVTAPSLPLPGNTPGNLNPLANTASPAELFPTLTWRFETRDDGLGLESSDLVLSKQQKTKEFLLIVEDLDGNSFLPLATPPLLGIFYGIPPDRSSISGSQLLKIKKGMLERITVAQRDLVGGFKYGDVDGKVWRTPKRGHRVHFQVVALSRSVDTTALSEHPTKESFRGAVEGFVLGWGEWVGIWDP